MTIKELRESIANMPDDLDVLFRRVSPITGNVEPAGHIEKSTYGFFGQSIPCVIIESYNEED